MSKTETMYAIALADNEAGNPRAFVAINKCSMPQHSTPKDNRTVKAKSFVEILAEKISSIDGVTFGNFLCTH